MPEVVQERQTTKRIKKPKRSAPDFSALDEALSVRLSCDCGTELINSVAAMRRAGFLPSSVGRHMHQKYAGKRKTCEALKLFASLVWEGGNAPFSLMSVQTAGRA